MQFITFAFLLFVAITVLAYYLFPIKQRWIVLLTASYLFYWINSKVLVLVLLGITVVTYLTGIAVEKYAVYSKQYIAQHKDELSSKERKQLKLNMGKKKKGILLIGIVLDLGTLLFLKYFNFFAGNLNGLLDKFGVNGKIGLIHILLPIGISFYTLQAISYMVDVYRDKQEADKNFLRFALYLSYFPQVVQGPISRYKEMAAQLYEGHHFNYSSIKYGAQLILWGFLKKLILADRIGVLVDTIFDDYRAQGGLVLLIGAMCYGIQVYADFTAGMDIAGGVSEMMGIKIPVNFRQPYFSRSIEEFWRRWHITLGAWMRDYIFYPLSLSKTFGNLGKITRKRLGSYFGKKLPSFLAMFIVYLLVGFWHGSSWKYIMYGLWNGVIITSGILLEPVYQNFHEKFHITEKKYGWTFFQIVRTFLICSVGRVFSRANSCMDAFHILKRIFTDVEWNVFTNGNLLNLGLDIKDILVLFVAILVLLIVDLIHEKDIKIREWISNQKLPVRWVIIYAAFFAVLLFGMYGPAYDSASFIYQQF